MPSRRPAGGGRPALEERFNEYYLATWHRVVTFLYAMDGDLVAAHEIAREAYVLAWQRWHRVVRYEDPESWFRMVATVLLIEHRRAARTDPATEPWHDPDQTVAPPSMAALVLVTALGQLPRDQRYAVVLYHVLGVPVSAIAGESGLPAKTVDALLAAGRRTLAATLGWEPGRWIDPAVTDVRFLPLYRETGKLRRLSAASLRQRGESPRPHRRVAVTATAAAVVVLAAGVLIGRAVGPEPSPPAVTPPSVTTGGGVAGRSGPSLSGPTAP